MPPVWSQPGRETDELRFDGPIPPPDPPRGEARATLFQRLAAEQRRDMADLRRQLAAARAAEHETLRRWQRSLRLYRDQGTAWLEERRG